MMRLKKIANLSNCYEIVNFFAFFANFFKSKKTYCSRWAPGYFISYRVTFWIHNFWAPHFPSVHFSPQLLPGSSRALSLQRQLKLPSQSRHASCKIIEIVLPAPSFFKKVWEWDSRLFTKKLEWSWHFFILNRGPKIFSLCLNSGCLREKREAGNPKAL